MAQPSPTPGTSLPTDVDDFISRFNQTGDWGATPWFLDPAIETRLAVEWDTVGLPREKRVIANSALKKIFPPEVVLEMNNDPAKWAGHVIALFGGLIHPGQVADLLDLGVNSDIAKPWLDRPLLRQLQLRKSHADAAFEVAVHAGLARAGAVVQRVPEAPPDERHDFDVTYRGVQYEIEAKLARASDLDRLAELVSSRVAAYDFIVPGLRLVLRGSDELAELAWDDPDAVEAALPELLAAHAAAIAHLRVSPSPGKYPAGRWGHVEAHAGHEHGSVEDQLLPDLPEEKKAARVLRKIRKGLGQMTGTRPGVLVVGLYRAAQPDLIQHMLLDDLRLGATLAKKCVMVVLCESVSKWDTGLMVPRRLPFFYAFSPLRVRQLRPAEMKLAVAVSSTHWSTSSRVDWEREGHISTRQSTNRPPRMLWSLGSKQVKPGETVTFALSGLPEKLPGR